MAECCRERRHGVPAGRQCGLNAALKKALDAFFEVFDSYSIEDLVKARPNMRSLLGIDFIEPRARGSLSKASAKTPRQLRAIAFHSVLIQTNATFSRCRAFCFPKSAGAALSELIRSNIGSDLVKLIGSSAVKTERPAPMAAPHDAAGAEDGAVSADEANSFGRGPVTSPNR